MIFYITIINRKRENDKQLCVLTEEPQREPFFNKFSSLKWLNGILIKNTQLTQFNAEKKRQIYYKHNNSNNIEIKIYRKS